MNFSVISQLQRDLNNTDEKCFFKTENYFQSKVIWNLMVNKKFNFWNTELEINFETLFELKFTLHSFYWLI